MFIFFFSKIWTLQRSVGKAVKSNKGSVHSVGSSLMKCSFQHEGESTSETPRSSFNHPCCGGGPQQVYEQAPPCLRWVPVCVCVHKVTGPTGSRWLRPPPNRRMRTKTYALRSFSCSGTSAAWWASTDSTSAGTRLLHLQGTSQWPAADRKQEVRQTGNKNHTNHSSAYWHSIIIKVLGLTVLTD